MDFSTADLFDGCDRLVAGLLERAGVNEPPVDALRIAEDHLGIPVDVVEPEEDDRGRALPRSRRPRSGRILISSQMTEEQRHAAAARGIADSLLPKLLHKLEMNPENASPQMSAHFRGLLAARILVPSRMLKVALRACKYDIPALKEIFTTASFETVAFRLLDLDDPCVIAVVDDAVVSTRRSNAMPAGRKLTPAEEQCLEAVMETDGPSKRRTGGWTAYGWPVPGRPFRRVVLRAVPDDI